MYGAVEVPGVGFSYKEMHFSCELRPQRFPIPLHDGAQVVMFLPVLGDFMVDFTGALVEDRLRITVFTNRTEGRLPDIELLSRAPVCSQYQFVVISLLHGGEHQSIGLAHFRPWHAPEDSLAKISVVVAIQIGGYVGAEVDHVRTEDPGSVVVVRIKHLRAESLPASSRSAVHRAGPAFPDSSEFLFNVRNEFLRNGVPIRPLTL